MSSGGRAMPERYTPSYSGGKSSGGGNYKK